MKKRLAGFEVLNLTINMPMEYPGGLLSWNGEATFKTKRQYRAAFKKIWQNVTPFRVCLTTDISTCKGDAFFISGNEKTLTIKFQGTGELMTYAHGARDVPGE